MYVCIYLFIHLFFTHLIISDGLNWIEWHWVRTSHFPLTPAPGNTVATVAIQATPTCLLSFGHAGWQTMVTVTVCNGRLAARNWTAVIISIELHRIRISEAHFRCVFGCTCNASTQSVVTIRLGGQLDNGWGACWFLLCVSWTVRLWHEVLHAPT